jgi:NADP-dependent 3-hydroxy acid dehydrogenase YdfG
MARFEPNPERRGAIVTGASSGIGRAIAVALAAAGHPVVVGARSAAALDEVVDLIMAEGGTASAVHLDLADPASPERFALAATEILGEVEILISNAAHNQVGAVLDMTSEELSHVLSVNLEGTHRLVRSVVPAMVSRRRGDVVIVTSDVVARPRPTMAAYVTSKWSLEGYARALQMEMEGTGVRATVVRPGPTLTSMGFDWDPELTGKVIEEWTRWGFGRHSNFMRPDGVAQAVVAVLELPRGVNVSTIELQPEAPIERDVP